MKDSQYFTYIFHLDLLKIESNQPKCYSNWPKPPHHQRLLINLTDPKVAQTDPNHGSNLLTRESSIRFSSQNCSYWLKPSTNLLIRESFLHLHPSKVLQKGIKPINVPETDSTVSNTFNDAQYSIYILHLPKIASSPPKSYPKRPKPRIKLNQRFIEISTNPIRFSIQHPLSAPLRSYTPITFYIFPKSSSTHSKIAQNRV